MKQFEVQIVSDRFHTSGLTLKSEWGIFDGKPLVIQLRGSAFGLKAIRSAGMQAVPVYKDGDTWIVVPVELEPDRRRSSSDEHLIAVIETMAKILRAILKNSESNQPMNGGSHVP